MSVRAPGIRGGGVWFAVVTSGIKFTCGPLGEPRGDGEPIGVKVGQVILTGEGMSLALCGADAFGTLLKGYVNVVSQGAEISWVDWGSGLDFFGGVFAARLGCGSFVVV